MNLPQLNRLADQGMQQLNGGLHIGEVYHFRGGMNIAARDRDAPGGNSGPGELDGACVCGSSFKDF